MELRTAEGDSAAKRIRKVYGEKYSPLLMMDSQIEVTELLLEDVEIQSIQEERKLANMHNSKSQNINQER